MNNKTEHLIKRLSIVLFALPAFIISLFLKRDASRIIFTAFLNISFTSNSKYLFLWFIHNIKNYNSYFVINNDELRNNLNKTIGNYFIETKTLKGKLFVLQASIWIISSLEIPVGCIFAKFKRTIIHLGHGTPLKNIGLLEKNISLIKRMYYMYLRFNISYSVASSVYFKIIISKFIGLPLNKILVAGQSRNDQLFVESDLDIQQFDGQKEMKNILYAPTWRPSTKLQLFPFDDFSMNKLSDFLLENKINIFIRTHPYFEDKICPELLKIPNIYLFSSTIYHEIMDYLNKFDMLVTDYSSIFFDYLLLDRPIIFLPYDYDMYNKEIGFTVPYDEFTPGYKSSSMKEFINDILNSFSIDLYKGERKRVNEICNAFKKENCKELATLLYNNNILS
jgi:CDP-glycerol glycerophosphotransferase